MASIPASQLVAVVPSVLSAGGAQLSVIGLMLSNSTRLPIGQVFSGPNATAFSTYFGPASVEYANAAVYFKGFDTSTVKPANLLCAQYNAAPVAAWLRGANVSTLTLAQLQAVTGSLSVTVDGYARSIASLVLTTATSFSAAAGLIQSGLNLSPATEASFTASVGATGTGVMGGSFTGCTTSGTTLTIGAVGSGSLWPGDLVSGTDTTNSLPAGCYIVQQLSGTVGGGAGATFQLSAAATPGNLTSTTVSATSVNLHATAVTGLVSIGDTVGGTSIPAGATVVSQVAGTAGGVGTYQLSCAAQSIASEAITVSSNVLDVTVLASGTLSAAQTVVMSGLTGSPTITGQTSGTAGQVGLYTISGAAQHVASESGTTTPTGAVVTFDSLSGGFLITSGATGAASTIAAATGTAAASLGLTVAVGAVLSQGAAGQTPAAFMTSLVRQTTNWAILFTSFDPDNGSGNSQKLAFAAWINSLPYSQFAYAAWDTDITPTLSTSATTSLGAILKAGNYSGTAAIYDPAPQQWLAAFNAGAWASVNWGAPNGRITLAFKGQSGLVPAVTDATVATNLIANGYNFYGSYATAAQAFNLYQPGSISGPFLWNDSYVNQIWLNAAIQSAQLSFLAQVNSVPYAGPGYNEIATVTDGPLQIGLTFGAITAGVALSPGQIASISAAAGNTGAAAAVGTIGYYYLIVPATATVRQARTSPVSIVWYADGGSIQKLVTGSVEVQ